MKTEKMIQNFRKIKDIKRNLNYLTQINSGDAIYLGFSFHKYFDAAILMLTYTFLFIVLSLFKFTYM